MNKIKEHSALLSVLLHLLPGLLILVLIFTLSNPVFPRLLGFDERLGPVVGYLGGILFGLIPIQLGILLIAGNIESGNYSIKKVIRFTESSRILDYLIYVPLMIVFFLIFFIVIAPIIQPFLVNTFFYWWPDDYNFQLLLQDPSLVSGYKGFKTLTIFYVILSGLVGPFVEELYFRGYLLPRMAGFSGKWAPLLNTILFSFYHFFSPWENPIRIVTGYPLFYLVWKKRNIRFSILVHLLINTVGGIVILFIIT